MKPVFTKDHDEHFYPELCQHAAELGASPLEMLSVMFSESGVRADAHNDGPPGAPYEKRYHASGLIQFMPATLPGVGWTHGHEEFRKLSATEQLPFVRRYYLPYKGHLGSIGGLYTATFLPALVAHAGDPAFVLTAKNGPLPWAYAPNAVFDANHDLAITVGELEDAVRRNCAGPRWHEIETRLRELDGLHEEPAPTEDEVLDLRTTRGMQRALARVGHDPGEIDGIPGPHTRAALVAFQRERGLAVDGIYGPRSREALEIALLTSA